jgi:hypothetical protein
MVNLHPVDAGSAEAWFVAGTIPPLVAGGGHLFLALVDTLRPAFFAPRDRGLIPALEGTRMRFGGSAAPSMWRAWLGFNISHGLGAFTFGLLCLLIATDDFDLVKRIDAIRPLTIAVSAAYLAMSLRFWFYIPTIAAATATACFSVAAVLSA